MRHQLTPIEAHHRLRQARRLGALAVELGVTRQAVVRVLQGKSRSARILDAALAEARKQKPHKRAA